jgi:hypothetical protein
MSKHICPICEREVEKPIGSGLSNQWVCGGVCNYLIGHYVYWKEGKMFFIDKVEETINLIHKNITNKKHG